MKGKKITKGYKWEVGNREKNKFWENPWIPTINGNKIITEKPRDCNIKKVRDVINQQTGE